jgi:hypothetical protein
MDDSWRTVQMSIEPYGVVETVVLEDDPYMMKSPRRHWCPHPVRCPGVTATALEPHHGIRSFQLVQSKKKTETTINNPEAVPSRHFPRHRRSCNQRQPTSA